jgi:hydrogenase small subunit
MEATMFLPELLALNDRPHGISRRNFLQRTLLTAAAAVGLPGTAAAEIEAALKRGMKPSVIWLHFSECTGCTESLLRTSTPGLDEVILDLISLDYHETLLVAAGHQAEAARYQAMKEHAGKYVLVVEGATPTKDGGIYCKIAGHTAVEMLEECAADAGAIIAIGSCASWGGIPSANMNPTGSVGVQAIVTDKPVVAIPGCPPNPYNFLGTVLQFATYGTLPELDQYGRPKFAYGRTIHEDCPRRPHFDAGRFAEVYGDQAHRDGHCLYKLGCKGPQTYANCSLQSFCEVPGAWPIGIGHPCFGCTEPGIGFTVAMHDTLPIPNPTPSTGFAPIHAKQGRVDPVATGVAGVVAGAAIGAGLMASMKLGNAQERGELPVEKAESKAEEERQHVTPEV